MEKSLKIVHVKDTNTDFLNWRSRTEIERLENNMESKEVKTYSLTEMKDKYICKIGTTDRDEYEYELRMELLNRLENGRI